MDLVYYVSNDQYPRKTLVQVQSNITNLTTEPTLLLIPSGTQQYLTLRTHPTADFIPIATRENLEYQNLLLRRKIVQLEYTISQQEIKLQLFRNLFNTPKRLCSLVNRLEEKKRM